MSYKKQELLTIREHPRFFLVRSVLLIVSGCFCVVLLCVFTFWVPCCVVRYDFCINKMVGCFQLFVGGLMSYLHYLCLFANSGVQHILCCVFVLFFFVLCTLWWTFNFNFYSCYLFIFLFSIRWNSFAKKKPHHSYICSSNGEN